MRLTYLDILEQCFREKFRGYSKQEVDTFLQLVADDFKEMAEELQQLKKEIDTRDRIIAQLKTSQNGNQNSGGASSHWNPETLKEKAKRVVHLAREQAELHRRKADLELDQLKKEIRKLKEEKTNLIQDIKAAAREQLGQNKK